MHATGQNRNNMALVRPVVELFPQPKGMPTRVPPCTEDTPFCSSLPSEAAKTPGADDTADVWEPRDNILRAR